MSSPSAIEELRDAISTVFGGASGRLVFGLMWALLAAALLGFLLSLLGVLLGVSTLGGLIAWGIIGALPWAYVRQVRAAREALRQAVQRGRESEGPQSHFGRVASLLALRDAFVAIRGGDGLLAEVELRKVDRADLGPWEARVYQAVLVLLHLERGEAVRAAQVAPLALPTGNEDLDRRLGCMMVKAAWQDERRLGAIEEALYAAGGALHDLVLLCRVHREEMARNEILQRFSPRVCMRVSQAALDVGDERLATALLALSDSKGPYR